MPKDIIECTLENRDVIVDGSDDEPGKVEQLSRQVVVGWHKPQQDDAPAGGGVTVGVVFMNRNNLHAELTRPEINRLIRTLRRARDGAFGADA